MFQQARMHVFQRGEQGSAIRCAGQDHHHHAATEDADDNFTYARLGDIPQLRDFYNINHRERDDRRRVAGQLESISGIIGKMRAGPGTKTDPGGHAKQEQPGFIQRMASNN